MAHFLENFSQYFWIHKYSIALIIIVFIAEIIARKFKSKNKKMILLKYSKSTDQENDEFYLQYYQKNQIIDFLRVIMIIFLIWALFVINTDINWGFFAVATGAIIIAFKDFILSIIAFFLVTPQYSVGTTVKVSGYQGQIIFIRMLSVGLMWRDSKGENTWELFVIPSHKFITDIVQKEELRTQSIFRDEIIIPYSAETFKNTFSDFMTQLRPFLQSIFPVNNAENVGNYPSYTGYRYKLDFNYHEDDYVGIHIRFVGKLRDNKEKKEKIIAFVDEFLCRNCEK